MTSTTLNTLSALQTAILGAQKSKIDFSGKTDNSKMNALIQQITAYASDATNHTSEGLADLKKFEAYVAELRRDFTKSVAARAKVDAERTREENFVSRRRPSPRKRRNARLLSANARLLPSNPRRRLSLVSRRYSNLYLLWPTRRTHNCSNGQWLVPAKTGHLSGRPRSNSLMLVNPRTASSPASVSGWRNLTKTLLSPLVANTNATTTSLSGKTAPTTSTLPTKNSPGTNTRNLRLRPGTLLSKYTHTYTQREHKREHLKH